MLVQYISKDAQDSTIIDWFKEIIRKIFPSHLETAKEQKYIFIDSSIYYLLVERI